MPIYTWVCPNCSEETEVFHRVYPTVLLTPQCPRCKLDMVRSFTTANFKLKWFTPLNGRNHKDPGPSPRLAGPAEITRTMVDAQT